MRALAQKVSRHKAVVRLGLQVVFNDPLNICADTATPKVDRRRKSLGRKTGPLSAAGLGVPWFRKTMVGLNFERSEVAFFQSPALFLRACCARAARSLIS